MDTFDEFSNPYANDDEDGHIDSWNRQNRPNDSLRGKPIVIESQIKGGEMEYWALNSQRLGACSCSDTR